MVQNLKRKKNVFSLNNIVVLEIVKTTTNKK